MKNFSIFIIKLLTLVVLLFTIGYLIWNIFQPEKAIETPVYKEFYAVKIYSSKNRIKTENLCKKLAHKCHNVNYPVMLIIVIIKLNY